MRCAAEWREQGKPEGLYRACCHPVAHWTYFRRIDSKALEGLEGRAQIWNASGAAAITSKQTASSAAVPSQRVAKASVATAAAVAARSSTNSGESSSCPACMGRHRAHTCKMASTDSCLACLGRHRPHTCGRQRVAAPPLPPPPLPPPPLPMGEDEEARRDAQRQLWLQPVPKPRARPSAPQTPGPRSSGQDARGGGTALTAVTPPPASAIADDPAITPPAGTAKKSNGASAMAVTPVACRSSKRERKPSAIVIAAAEASSASYIGKRAHVEIGRSCGWHAAIAPVSSAALARTGVPTRAAGERHPQPIRMRLDDADDEARFLAAWTVGEPIVAAGIGSRLKEKWTPEGFSSMCGHLEVPLIDTRTGATFQQPLRDFLNGFRRPESRPKPPASSSRRAPGSSLSSSGSAAASGSAASVVAAAAAATSASADPSETLLKLKDRPGVRFRRIPPATLCRLHGALPFDSIRCATGRSTSLRRSPTGAFPGPRA